MNPTFDVSVEFSFGMQIFETFEKFSHNDCDVFLSEYTRLHLNIQSDV